MDDDPRGPIDYQHARIERPRERRKRLDAREDVGCLGAVMLVVLTPFWACAIAPWLIALTHVENPILLGVTIFTPAIAAVILCIGTRFER